MAKLKARGRQEIFRVRRVEVPRPGQFHDDSIAEIHHFRALTTDGNVLSRMVMYYTPEEVRKNYGKTHHDYGWKVKGRAKAGRSVEELLRFYLEKEWELEDASDSYFRRVGDGMEGISQAPLVTEAKAAKRREQITKRREKASHPREYRAVVGPRESRGDGPGFYVTNNYTGAGLRSRVADHPEPFPTYESAEEWAWSRYRHLLEMQLDYLLPVDVVESPSRADAESLGGSGHVWWRNGKHLGPPIDPRQTGLRFAE
jgi:hypothetical protein